MAWIIDIFPSSAYVNPSNPTDGLVFTALDITERKVAENKLHYHTGLLHLVLDVSTSFINLSPGEIDRGINNALKMIGEFLRVDQHSYLFNSVKKASSWTILTSGAPRKPPRISLAPPGNQ